MTGEQAPFKISQIGQIGITVRDLDRAVTFYRATLGLPFLFRVPNLAFFDCAGVRVMLSPPERPEFDHPASILYYKVDDLNAAYSILGSVAPNSPTSPTSSPKWAITTCGWCFSRIRKEIRWG